MINFVIAYNAFKPSIFLEEIRVYGTNCFKRNVFWHETNLCLRLHSKSLLNYLFSCHFYFKYLGLGFMSLFQIKCLAKQLLQA